MREIDIAMRKGALDQEIVKAIDLVCREAGLTQMSKGSLRKYPGCVHWHYKLGDQTGTLEITFWPEGRRAWFALRPNRFGAWMDALVPQLKADIERWLIANPSEVRA
jgi:hypothetical protein